MKTGPNLNSPYAKLWFSEWYLSRANQIHGSHLIHRHISVGLKMHENACCTIRTLSTSLFHVFHLYMASLATTTSSAVWHKWSRSFRSSLSINSFLCSFWLKSSIKLPVHDEKLSRMSEHPTVFQKQWPTVELHHLLSHGGGEPQTASFAGSSEVWLHLLAKGSA